MLKMANEKMRDLNDAGRSRSGIETAAGGPLLDRKGFTSRDLKVLQEAHQRGIADRGWGRGQFVTNEFSEYLAIWNDASADHEGRPYRSSASATPAPMHYWWRE